MVTLAEQLGEAEAPADIWRCETAMWTELARIAGNRIYEREMKWWARITAPKKETSVPSPLTPAIRTTFYKELLRRILANEGAAKYYLEMAQLVLQQPPV